MGIYINKDRFVYIITIVFTLFFASCTGLDLGKEAVEKKSEVLQEKSESIAPEKVEVKEEVVHKDAEKMELTKPSLEREESKKTDEVFKPPEVKVKDILPQEAERSSEVLEIQIPSQPEEPRPPVVTEAPLTEDYPLEEAPQYPVDDGPPPDIYDMEEEPPVMEYSEDDGPPPDIYDMEEEPPVVEYSEDDIPPPDIYDMEEDPPLEYNEEDNRPPA